MLARTRTKIQYRFVATIMVLMLAFLMLLLVGTYTIEIIRISNQVESELAAHAASKIEKADLRLSYIKESIDAFASSSLAINSMIDASGRSSYLPSAVKDLARTKEIKSIIVFDFSGRPLENQDQPLPAWYNARLVQRTIALQRNDFRLLEKEGAFLLVVPINYYESAQGGIAVEIDIHELLSDILDTENYGYMVLINNNLKLDYHLPESEDYKSSKFTSNSKLLGRYNTTLSVYLPDEIAMRPVWVSLSEMSVIGIIGIIVSLIVAMRVGRRLSQPILLLTDRVKNNVHPTGPLGTGDELDQLAESFDLSTKKLLEAKNILEARVDERTSQLREHTDIIEKRSLELERVNTELKTLDKMKDEFISTVSHELRTPLTSIHGVLGLIINGALKEDEKKQNELLITAFSNSERLSQLINDLLDFSKLMADQLVLDIEAVSINDMIDNVIEDAKGYMKKYDVSITHLPEKMCGCYIKADKSRIRQVMDNLVSNAIKYSPVHSEVDIYTQQTNGKCRIYVRDHGDGIPNKFRDKIFDKFSRVDSSDTRLRPGTGLGLSISKRLMDAHKGKIDFEPAPGGGTIFWIELDMAQAPESVQSETATQAT